ncbi:hypothetical protein [Benzoatithermus flavus]|uniref:Uncharacterized protein n=1 Tax=Benzoatithermus flavus TaxID=3108223 RepID=A0ABU8XX30_9PROT
MVGPKARRERARWIVQDHVGSAGFESAVPSALVPLDELYRDVAV